MEQELGSCAILALWPWGMAPVALGTSTALGKGWLLPEKFVRMWETGEGSVAHRCELGQQR